MVSAYFDSVSRIHSMSFFYSALTCTSESDLKGITQWTHKYIHNSKITADWTFFQTTFIHRNMYNAHLATFTKNAHSAVFSFSSTVCFRHRIGRSEPYRFYLKLIKRTSQWFFFLEKNHFLKFCSFMITFIADFSTHFQKWRLIGERGDIRITFFRTPKAFAK